VTRRLLVVTADDFGLTEGVCRAIVAGHREGVVTATSVLAVGRALRYGAALLRDTPSLAVGAHLALVGEDPPVLSAAEVPTLVDRKGRFPLSYRTVVRRAAQRRIDPDDVRREFAAQLEALRAERLSIGHLDTHQHTHLWPSIGSAVLDLARQERIPVVRLPASAARGPVGRGVRVLARRLRGRLAAAGIATTDAYAGLDEAGRLDAPLLSRALLRARDAGAASLEVNSHPGERGDADLTRFAWDYRWSDELDLLTAQRTAETIRRLGFRLASPAELLQDGAPA
jgi:predicted glycoside hydrolase/deacetylase ChbG (UPF0249 family)